VLLSHFSILNLLFDLFSQVIPDLFGSFFGHHLHLDLPLSVFLHLLNFYIVHLIGPNLLFFFHYKLLLKHLPGCFSLLVLALKILILSLEEGMSLVELSLH
jgi:hypothetical protein